MSSRVSRLLAFALACFAWLAQLCLPVAHAAAAMSGGAGAAICGVGSPALAVEFAALPHEIRRIVDACALQR